jgi:hypothetical protein
MTVVQLTQDELAQRIILELRPFIQEGVQREVVQIQQQQQQQARLSEDQVPGVYFFLNNCSTGNISKGVCHWQASSGGKIHFVGSLHEILKPGSSGGKQSSFSDRGLYYKTYYIRNLQIFVIG